MSDDGANADLIGDNGTKQPIMAPSPTDARILAGASNETSEENRQQLMEKILDLEAQLDVADDEKREQRRLRREAEEELKEMKKNQLQETKKTSRAKKERTDAATALADGFKGRDVVGAREMRSEKEGEDNRIPIDSMSRLHPDFECESCGPILAGKILPADDLGGLKSIKIKTLRQLGALIDVSGTGEKLSVLEGMTRMEDKAESKDVSTIALKKAYTKGICMHALDDVRQVRAFGVSINDEEVEVSDAVTEVLCARGGRVSRRSYVLIVPSDSVVARLRGEWKKMEEMKYDEFEDLKKTMQAMDGADTFPKNLIILLKNAISMEHLGIIKAYILDLVKKRDITVYISADVIPAKPSPTQAAVVITNQSWLTAWKLECPPKNLIIMSQFSATIWTMIPFINIFVVAGKEAKILLEEALMHIVDGKTFAFPENQNDKMSGMKRRSDDGGEGSSKKPFPKKTFYSEKKTGFVPKCYNCHERGHYSRECGKDLDG